MVEVLAKVRLPAQSGLTDDEVTNDMAFDMADLAAATVDGVQASIVSFYNGALLQTASIAARINNRQGRAANLASVDYYDVSGALDGSPAGSPFATRAWTLGAAAAGANYPAEVALRVSLIADGWEEVPETAVDGSRPRARYRGGFYLGPLSASSGLTGSDGTVRPVATLVADLDAAALRFMDERGGDFCVWSRADQTFRLVAPGGRWSVDNAFDTIRKRGTPPTVRTTVWP